MDGPLVAATRRGIVVHAGENEIAAMRDELAQCHVVRLRKFLDDDLLDRVMQSIDAGAFATREDAGIAVELCLDPSRALDILTFAMNSAALFDFVRAISGCEHIGHFAGRIYRFDPRVTHHDSWHDDTAGDGGARRLGFSLNLSRERYCGGTFQLREKAWPDAITSIENTRLADAFLFRIAPELQHRVTAVEGSASKTAFAGWFIAGDIDLRTMLTR